MVLFARFSTILHQCTQPQWQDRCARGLQRALWFACIWSVGQLVWFIWPKPDPVVLPPTAPVQVQTTPTHLLTESDLGVVFQQQWFGSLAPTPIVDEPAKKVIVPTKLNFVLRGVAPSQDAARSVAVIEAQGKQQSYMLGEKVGGSNVTLLAVEPLQVLLDNAGQHEVLRLPGEPAATELSARRQSTSAESNTRSSTHITTKTPPVQETAVSDEPAAESTAINTELAAVRALIAQDPQKVLNYIRLSPIRKEKTLVGYRVSPGANRALFDSFGLKDQDIAVALNGLDLTDDQQAMQVMQQLATLTSITLTVQRAGMRYDILVTP
ncbi:MAG: type II secretion system protein GspC [Plesiomonas sp.]|uniref:type II secretion system protein GspC n=1 Tax=Plesiomonas sp. TaxID=2486279 RepID=UPI003F3697D0